MRYLALLIGLPLLAQYQPTPNPGDPIRAGNSLTTTGAGAPANPCTAANFFYVDSGGTFYFCPGAGQNWVAVVGGTGAPTASHYILQTADGTLPNAQVLASLATGILKSTTTTGVLSDAASADVISLWTGTCSATTLLHGAGACGAAVLTTDVSGILPFANGGLGTNSNFLAHTVFGNNTGSTAAPSAVQLACGDLSNSTASCSTDMTNVANAASGLLALARGGTHTDLSGTGGAHSVLFQSTLGGNITVAQPNFTDLAGSIALGQTPLTTNGDLLVVSGGVLARLPLIGNGLCYGANAGAITGLTCAAGSGGANGINPQTSGYTLVSGDNAKLVTMNGASLTATLPATPPSATWTAWIENLAATALTVSRNGLTINGASSNITLNQFDSTYIWTDGTNYFASRLPTTAGSGLSSTPSATGFQLSLNTAIALTNANAEAGKTVFCNSTTGTTAYTCSLPAAALTAYTTGQPFLLVADATCSASCSLDVDHNGARSITLIDGATAPNGAIVAGQPNWIYNDGVVFRLIRVQNGALLAFPGTLSIASGKTFTASNTLTMAGTDGTTMTFPTTSATIARTDAANTFTGHQTIEGVTSTGATGTGNFVFATSPTLTTPALGVATATSLNGLTVTTSTGTLTVPNGVTLTGPASSATVVGLGINNAYTGGYQDFKNASDARLASVANGGFTNEGDFGYDYTLHGFHFLQVSTERFVATLNGTEALQNKTLCDGTTVSKCFGFSSSGASSSTTATLSESNTASRTYTLLDAAQTLHGTIQFTNPGTQDVICALHTDTISGITCANGADATTDTPFASTYTIPANFLTTGRNLRITAGFGIWSSATAVNFTFKVKAGSTVIYSSNAPTTGIANSMTNFGFIWAWDIVGTAAAGASANVFTDASFPAIGGLAGLQLINRTVQPVALATNGSIALTLTIDYTANTAGNAIQLQWLRVEALD